MSDKDVAIRQEIQGAMARIVDASTYNEARNRARGAVALQYSDDAARDAGLYEWVKMAGNAHMNNISNDVSEALRMLVPSPFIAACLEKLGHPQGLQTKLGAEWSMALGARQQLGKYDGFDTGVRLVCKKESPQVKSKVVPIPLDIIVTSDGIHNIKAARPDKVSVQIGARQLPGRHTFSSERAQVLLWVADRFMGALMGTKVGRLQLPGR